jgi:lysophospholipase L1-like esterase
LNLTVLIRGLRASVIVSALALAACSKSTSVPPVGPPAIVYTAIGASDAVGYNASIPCANPPSVAVPTCPGGTGYVPVLATLLGASGAPVTLNDRGISGAVIGPDILAMGNMYGSQVSAVPCKPRTGNDVIPADFITNELPSLSGNETLVTIFAGGNDTNAIVNAAVCLSLGGASNAAVQQFLATQIQAFGNDFVSLTSAIHAKAPGALIVVANLPNFAGIPIAQNPQVAPAKPLLQAVSVGIDTNVYLAAATNLGIPTVDLLCDPRSYQNTSFFPGPLADGFHPNDTGYAIFAAAFAAQIAARPPVLPQKSCPQMSLASNAMRPLAAAIPNFDRR